MLQFPIANFFDEHKCYDYLMKILHPKGLHCPCGKPLPRDQAPHKKQRRPSVVDYQCRFCGKVFNLFTQTVWSGSSYACSTILRILQGFSEGVPTLHLSQELGIHYGTLLERRHQLYGNAFDNRPNPALEDAIAEGDELFQNAGEKGTPHPDPDDPPRRRANNRVGLGTMENDRPPIQGVVGRTSGKIRLDVCDNTQQKTIQPQVEKKHQTP
jgi:transposase-like protein